MLCEYVSNRALLESNFYRRHGTFPEFGYFNKLIQSGEGVSYHSTADSINLFSKSTGLMYFKVYGVNVLFTEIRSYLFEDAFTVSIS